MNFTDDFFDLVQDGCLASAQVVVPQVMKLLKSKKVIDIGCGCGWWLSVFARHGCQVHGVDGDYVKRSRLAIPEDCFEAADIASPEFLALNDEGVLGDPMPYDLAVCLEVAEHLTLEASYPLIDKLCRLAPYVLFSAAAPGQGGQGHCNEQLPQFWVQRFRANGYAVSGGLRWAIWDDERVEPWYRQNLLLAVAAERLVGLEGELADVMYGVGSRPVHVIHPSLREGASVSVSA